MKRESFIFYRSFWEAVKELKPAEREKILSGICSFMFDDEEPELKGICKAIWILIKPQLLANIKKYINGSKGGRPKKETKDKPKVNENEKPNQNQEKTKGKPNDNPMYNEECLMNNEECRMINEEGKMSNGVSVLSDDITVEPPVILLMLNDKTEYPIYKSKVDEWSELYPNVNVIQELRKMKGWLDANPTKKKTKRGILKFVNSWLCREQDKSHGSNGGMAF